VKYTYAQGQVTTSEDMPRPDVRGRGRGRGQLVEAEVEAEDKISASRTVWPRGLNITDVGYCGFAVQLGALYNIHNKSKQTEFGLPHFTPDSVLT